jgi:hypothetical protein
MTEFQAWVTVWAAAYVHRNVQVLTASPRFVTLTLPVNPFVHCELTA